MQTQSGHMNVITGAGQQRSYIYMLSIGDALPSTTYMRLQLAVDRHSGLLHTGLLHTQQWFVGFYLHGKVPKWGVCVTIVIASCILDNPKSAGSNRMYNSNLGHRVMVKPQAL
jgi:hypothetical protein